MSWRVDSSSTGWIFAQLTQPNFKNIQAYKHMWVLKTEFKFDGKDLLEKRNNSVYRIV